MARKSLVLFSILVLLLAAQEVVVKTKALTEAQTEALTEELKEAETEALTEVLTEAETVLEACWRRLPVPCHQCHARCIRLGGIRSRCTGGRCFCLFPRCLPNSDVLTEAQTEELKEALTEAQTEAMTEALTEAQMEALTEAQMEEQTEAPRTCDRPSKYFKRPCITPLNKRRCHLTCVRRERAIRGHCKHHRCFCTFRHCRTFSDVLEE